VQTRAEDGALYLTQAGTGSSSAQLRSFDLQSGRERWSRDLSFSVEFPPFPRTPGSAILLAEGSTLASYEASSGTRRWQTQYPSEGATDLRVSYPTDNIFILADGTGNITQNQLVGIDRQTGEIQWQNTIDLPGEQLNADLPFFTSGSTGLVSFTTAQGHRILRLNPSTGDVVEQYTAQIAAQVSSAGTSPSFAFVEREENFVTIASQGGGVEVVRAFDSLEAVENDPVSVISGGNIRELFNVTGTPETKAYAVQTEGGLRAVALPTTETLWEISIPSDVTEEIRRQTANRIYTTRFTPTSEGGFDGEVVARSNSTGEEQWSKIVVENVGTDRSRPPFLEIDELGESQLAVRQTNGVVVSLDNGTGEVGQWAVSLPGEGQDLFDFSFDVNNRSNVVVGEVEAGTFESQETTVSVFPTPSGDGSGSFEELSVSLSRSSVPAGGQSELAVEVTETATGEAVSGATVSVSKLGLSVTTDNTGAATLSFTDATPGEYTLSVSVEGYITASETVTVTEESANVFTRTVSSDEVVPGEEVTVTTEIPQASGAVSITSSYEPPVSEATIQSVTVGGASGDPIISEATANGSTVTLGDVGSDVTVTVTESLTVGEETDVIHEITGEVTAGETTTEVDPETVTVAEPQSVVDEYDTDNDGTISITELGAAGADFASGELSITELGRLGAEFAS
jgi:hypothetical protein